MVSLKFLLYFLFEIASAVILNKNAYQLLKDKAQYISTVAAPVLAPNSTTEVTLIFYVQHIKMKEDQQMVEVGGILEHSWKNEYMTWDPDDYGGLQSVRAYAYRFWKPDISPYNGYFMSLWFRDQKERHVRISYNGNVRWRPSVVSHTNCPMDYTQFPNDEQVCELILGSWSYSKSGLDLITPTSKQNKSSMTKFDKYENVNPKWELLNVEETRIVQKFSSEDYVSISIKLKLKRRLSLFQATLTTPIMVGGVLVVITFLLYPWHEQRLSCGLLAILLLVGISFQLAWALPKTSTVPKIVKMCRSCLISASSAVFCSALLAFLTKEGCFLFNEPPKFILDRISGSLGKFLCIYGASNTAVIPGMYERSTSVESAGSEWDSRSSDHVNGWKLLALVLDRLLLVIFIIVLISISIS